MSPIKKGLNSADAYLFVIAFLGVLVFSPNLVNASTIVPQNINSNTKWTVANSPYIVENPVTVGAVLTIEPGVIVKFSPGKYLRVDGKLVANGTEANKIYFTSLKDDTAGGDTNGDCSATLPAPRDWGYIKINSSLNNSLSHVVVRYGGAPHGNSGYVGIHNAGKLSIPNSTISDNGDQGIFN